MNLIINLLKTDFKHFGSIFIIMLIAIFLITFLRYLREAFTLTEFPQSLLGLQGFQVSEYCRFGL